MRLVYVGNHYNAHLPFKDMFDKIIDITHETEDFSTFPLSEDDVVLFGGGADIWTGFYGQAANRYSGGTTKSRRDLVEEQVFQNAVASGAKMLGICRGAQFLCAVSGGTVVQHVTNHAGHDHPIMTDEGIAIPVCSVHHQMMNPFPTKHKLIAWAAESLSTCYLAEKEKNIEMPYEPEVVYFPETRALGIQYHPEFMAEGSQGVVYARELVRKYLMEAENV